MRVGLSIDPPLATIPALLRQEGVDVYQTVLRDPGRFGNYGVPEPADRAALVEGLEGRRVWGVAHGSLLINLASPEGRIRNSSVSSLLADLKVAAEVGLDAVCFHVGYAKGHPSAEAALTLATRKLGELIARMPEGPRLLLENSCEGSELGQTIPELARLVRDVGAPGDRFGLLIDTCHLHAAGFDLSGEAAGQRLADALADEGMLERVVAFHLNDCQLPCGAHRDRHAAPGAGTIGMGVISVATHPPFATLPGVLELSIEDARQGLAFLRQHGATSA
ncbi:MAG TPA: TIM barrel protein [Methylomirabilota bacterium]|jgi:deoxyribonuclease-4|nr:TIM barrel protein [Methylomirabilota bacterium]